MIKGNFLEARNETEKFLKKANIEHHMYYGPVSEAYFSEKYRILFINMEPYGYEDCGLVNVDENTLLSWFQDEGDTDTRTVKYSLAFCHVLMNCLNIKEEAKYEDFQNSYKNIDELKTILKKIVYYNIRPTSNSEKSQDYIRIIESGENQLSKFISNELKSLEPNFIIIGGDAGLYAFNTMSGTDIKFKDVIIDRNGTIIGSIKHPSRPNYNEYVECINEILKKISVV